MLKNANKFLWFLLILFALILPISSFLSTRILFLLLTLSLVIGETKIRFYELFKSSWDIALYFVVLGLGIIYSLDKATGISTLETSFALLALPVICYQFKNLIRDRLNRVFLIFSIGTVIAGLICLLSASVAYLNGRNTEVFFFYYFTQIIDSHPTYLAYYLIFSITFGLYTMNYEKSQIPIWVIVVLITFSFFILLLTGGQTAFISLLFILSFFFLKYLLNQQGKTLKLTVALATIMVLVFFYISSGDISQREQVLNDSWDRYELWRSGVLANSDPLWGVGTGDYKEILTRYYEINHQDGFAKESLNTHNQFIQIFFSNGILGLISISIMILRPLYMAFKNNDQMGILMIFPFLIYGMTEVFLGRYQGVAFFALLHQVFISYYMYSKTSGST
jgi:O-antigen ligase